MSRVIAVKNIILISPPAHTFAGNFDINPLPPMGMGYLAAVLREYGFNVKIIDSLGRGWHIRNLLRPGIIKIGLTDKMISREIDSFKPEVIGISNLFSKQFNNALELARLIKSIDRNILVVIGGAHPTADPDSVMAHAVFDCLVEGEGEIPLLKFLQYITGKVSESALEAVYIRDGDNIRYYPRKSWLDFEKIPFPAFDLMNLELYFGLNSSHGKRRHERFMPIITSRGCPAKCVFCSAHKVGGYNFRKRNIESVIEEMKFLRRHYSIKELMFEDDNVTLDTRRAHNLFVRMVDEQFDFEWDTPNGVAAFALNNKIVALMKRAGCYHINLAVESGNQEHLSMNIKKPLKLCNVPPLVDYCRRLNISVNAFLVFGVPGETVETIWDSVKFAASMGIYRPYISIATPYPGTELFEICRQRGYLKEDFGYEDLHIRSFCIDTPELPSDVLKNTLNKVTLWLRLQEFKASPIKVISEEIYMTIKKPKRIGEFIRKAI